jgi:hypothetical protein
VTSTASASYNRVMHRVSCLFALVLCAWLAAGCASSHKNGFQPYGAGAARMALHEEVKAARASDHLYATFPAAPGQRKCLIPWEGGVHTVKIVYRGVCRRNVRPGPPAIVVFSERWLPCLKGQDCMAGVRLRRHSWLLTMKPLTTQPTGSHYQKPVIRSTRQQGDQPPQGPRP